MPVTADEFLFRVPHPLFGAHHALEDAVARESSLPHLRSSIITAGAMYGEGESLFEFMFRAAWLPFESGVPLIGNGLNHVPMIHVRDCCSIVMGVLQQTVPESAVQPLCHIAVDRTKHDLTMGDVASAVSEGFQVRADRHGPPQGGPPLGCVKGADVVRLGVADAYLFDDLTE